MRRAAIGRVIVAAAALAAVMTGCGDDNGGGADAVEPGQTSAPTPTPSESPADSQSPPSGDPEAVAVADLADHAGVAENEIEVVSHDQVTWRDGSLGCPEPGMSYTQALVEGYRIVLRAGGQDVAYHGAEGGAPTRCDTPDPDGFVGTDPDT